MKIIKHVVRFVIITISLIVLLWIDSVRADDFLYIIPGGIETYTFGQIQEKYQTNSITYLRNNITYQIEALNSDIANENYNNLNGQYVEVIQRIAELNSTREQLIAYRNSLIKNENNNLNDSILTDTNDLIQEINNQIATIDTQLANLNSTKSSLMNHVSSAKLQEDTEAFYKEYQQILLQQSRNKLTYEFLKECFGLVVVKEQLEYYNVNGQYLELVAKAETIKFNKGASTQSKVDDVSLECMKNENMILYYQNIFDNTKDYIRTETNTGENITLKLDIEVNQKSYDLDTVTKIFLASNTTYMQLQNYIKSYQNYMNYNTGISYETYQQMMLKIQDYQMQQGELNNKIKVYVKNAIKSHQYVIKQKDTAKRDLDLNVKNCNVVQKKIDNKKATTIELYKAKIDKEMAELTYYKCCYKIILWEYIIDNCIYDVTLE